MILALGLLFGLLSIAHAEEAKKPDGVRLYTRIDHMTKDGPLKYDYYAKESELVPLTTIEAIEAFSALKKRIVEIEHKDKTLVLTNMKLERKKNTWFVVMRSYKLVDGKINYSQGEVKLLLLPTGVEIKPKVAPYEKLLRRVR